MGQGRAIPETRKTFIFTLQVPAFTHLLQTQSNTKIKILPKKGEFCWQLVPWETSNSIRGRVLLLRQVRSTGELLPS